MREGFIELKNGRYFIGWWFVSAPGVQWFGTVFRNGGKLISGKSEWYIRYSFRYLHPRSTRSHDLDTKRRYAATFNGTEEEAFNTCEQVFGETARQLGRKIDYIELRTDTPEEIFKKLKDKPWANLKELR